MLALIWLTAFPAWAVEYRLQVANIDDRSFASYAGKAGSWTREKEPLGRLDARLDQERFSPAAILPGHYVALLEDPAYGGMTPTRVSLLPATGHQDWSTYVFDAKPGATVAFVVRTDMDAWPEVSEAFLATAVDRGTFPQWAAQHAKAVDGVSFVVGQGDNPQYDPDRVYIVLKLPPQPHTFQAVIGWQDRGQNRQPGLD
jgi:hypothetical protein